MIPRYHYNKDAQIEMHSYSKTRIMAILYFLGEIRSEINLNILGIFDSR